MILLEIAPDVSYFVLDSILGKNKINSVAISHHGCVYIAGIRLVFRFIILIFISLNSYLGMAYAISYNILYTILDYKFTSYYDLYGHAAYVYTLLYVRLLLYQYIIVNYCFVMFTFVPNVTES